jgi:hypothetical protein
LSNRNRIAPFDESSLTHADRLAKENPELAEAVELVSFQMVYGDKHGHARYLKNKALRQT